MALWNELQKDDDKISKSETKTVCTHDFAGSEQNFVRSLKTEERGEREREREKKLEALRKLQYNCKFWMDSVLKFTQNQTKVNGPPLSVLSSVCI